MRRVVPALYRGGSSVSQFFQQLQASLTTWPIGSLRVLRLLNLARQDAEDFQLVFTRFAAERLLNRLSKSGYEPQFILKGAMLFQLWGGAAHRPTRDLDLLGQGPSAPTHVAAIFSELCALKVEDDGLHFLTESVRAERIKADEEPADVELAEVVIDLREFVSPIMSALANGERFEPSWTAGGPWASESMG